MRETEKEWGEGREVVGRKGEKKPWGRASRRERERLGEVRERTVLGEKKENEVERERTKQEGENERARSRENKGMAKKG